MSKLMVLPLVALAFGLTRGLIQAEECQDMEPSTTATPTYGAFLICPEQSCPQNYAIQYTYACDIPSPGYKCGSDEVKLAEVFNWECDMDGRCKERNAPIMGTGLVKKSCTATE
jgi:hypothetical protein